MKMVHRVWKYFLNNDDHPLSLLTLAVAAATSGSGSTSRITRPTCERNVRRVFLIRLY
jgi:hypothetical protein